MKNIISTAVILLGLGAIIIGYGTYSAVGQSAQGAFWRLEASASQPPFAWKINANTGVAYFCMAAQQRCVRMNDDR